MSARRYTRTVLAVTVGILAFATSQCFGLTVDVVRPTCDPLIVVEDYQVEFEAAAWDENQTVDYAADVAAELVWDTYEDYGGTDSWQRRGSNVDLRPARFAD